MYHKESYPDESVEIDVIDFREHKDTNSVIGKVSTDYGETKIAYGFPKGHGWSEKLNGKKKFLLKLKDMALNELKPDEEESKEKESMKEMMMSEKQEV